MCHKSQLNGHLHLEIVDRKAKKREAETAEKQIHSQLVLETKQQNDKMPTDTAATGTQTETETEMRTASQGRCQALKLSGLLYSIVYSAPT